MEKYFLFKREKEDKEVSHDPINGDNFYYPEPVPQGFILDKVVNTEEEVLMWMKENYYNTYKVIKGEEIEFNIAKKTTVNIEIRKNKL